MFKELELESNFHEVLERCEAAEVDALAERLKTALRLSGSEINLDGINLRDAGKQEELVQLFGEGWGAALYDCMLLQPPDPVPDLLDEDSKREEEEMAEESLLDAAEAMVLSLKSELGVALPALEEETASTDSAIAQLLLLSDLSPQQLVTKLVARNRRKRLREAAVAEQAEATRRTLTGERGRAPCLDTVLNKWPDVGDKIEAICADLQVGADASRRDGAVTLNQAVQCLKGGTGFTRIRIELEKRHGIVLSAQAMRYLCVARDKRMRESARYRGVVNLKMRRSVKRITQENLDDHSSNAMYQLVHYLRDRCPCDSTLWFQRDDHSKCASTALPACCTAAPICPTRLPYCMTLCLLFSPCRVRGGSSESTRQHGTVTATGTGASTLQHDYMNTEVSSTLYATSILVSGCADGLQRCLATVKAEKLSPSSPTQHMADFYMLQQMARSNPNLKSIFFKPNSLTVKPVVQLEVDGGADENPEGRETRFLQAELLLGGPLLDPLQRRAQVGTTTRNAGASALNMVERLNGEETSAAAGFHAMPTDDVVGDLHDDATGQYDEAQLIALWKHHVEEYRKMLDGRCGLNKSVLMALPGAEVASCQEAKLLLERRPVLLRWLDPKLSKVKMAELEKSEAVHVAHFKKVLVMQVHTEQVRHYASTVRCCLSTVCVLCKDAPRLTQWYEEGPSLKPMPPALRDVHRPGHYLEPEPALAKYASANYKLTPQELKSPSDLALEIYEREMGNSLGHFPEAKLAAAVQEINDSRIDVVALKRQFIKLRFIRLRVLEGRRKGAETRKKNAAVRALAAAPSV